jgi:hypothetical protein
MQTRRQAGKKCGRLFLLLLLLLLHLLLLLLLLLLPFKPHLRSALLNRAARLHVFAGR